ncbi:MAG: hypothetical protein Q8N53_24080 [Longimicrobiales bacterium]|nr:hypothetical protein [Longimicrobiales bacterium]
MRTFSRYLAISATVAFVVATAFLTSYTPVKAVTVGCPPDVETCHETPRALPGYGCVGSECFSEVEWCCIE